MADNQDSNWRTLGFRQNVREKIEDAIRMSGNPTSKNPAEMETHVFQKAKTREEYLSYVARLIIHVREMNSKKSMTGAVPTPTMASSSVPNPGSQVSDPMSALRNMAGQGSGGTITIQSQPGQTQMTAALLGSGATISQMASPAQPQPQVQVPSLGPGVIPTNSNSNIATSSMSQQGINPMIMQQTRFLGSVGGIVASPQQIQQRPPMMAPNVQMQMPKFRQPQGQQGPPPNVTSTSIPHQGGFNENLLMQSQQPSPVSSQFQGHSPASMQSQGPNSNQTAIPSPVGQHPSNASSQLVPSPAGYAPSPTSQIAPSPVGSYPARTPAGAPSPGSALNTPAGPVATPSPISRGTQEDLYNEKRKQLSKYIEPLKKMISRIDKDENKKKELSRMKNLLDILADPNKRCSMDVLLKCEQVLEKMGTSYNDPACAPQPTVPIKSQEQNICQPLLDALTNHIKSPLFNHTMQKTFGPAVTALFGPPTRIPSPPPKRKKIEDDASEISDVLQGEIARLDQRFKVQLDPAQHQCSRTVNLICQLDDKNIPCVPPIRIIVPENYPDMPPQCNCKEEYESTKFLCRVKEVLSCHLSSMPQKYSITSLLDTWEMSVRQTCAPRILVDEK